MTQPLVAEVIRRSRPFSVRPNVQDLGPRVVQPRLHVIEAADHGLVRPRCEPTRFWGGLLESDWPAFVNPAVPDAIEDAGVRVAVVVKYPPQPGGVEHIAVVISNNRSVVRHAELFHEIPESLGPHDMQASFGFFQPTIYREPYRTRDMRAAVALQAGAVNDPNFRIASAFPEPVGLG